MRVLVTGGAGYIGSHTLVELAAVGHEALVVDNFSTSTPAPLDGVAAISGKTPRVIIADVRDAPAMVRICADFKPDAAIHFAGLKSVAESASAPLEYYDVNFCGTVALARALNACGCRRLVFSSSATVYGEPQRLPIDEDHPLSAINPYGRSKLMVEDMLRDLAAADPACGVAILRYFNPVGAHPSALIGETPVGAPANLAPFVADVAARVRPGVVIFGDDYPTPDGTGVRDYIHVVDLALAHVAALEWTGRAAEERLGARAFNVGVGRGFSVLEMIDAFERASGRKISHRTAARRPGDVAACVADISRAQREMGWRAVRGVPEMARDAWAWRLRLGVA